MIIDKESLRIEDERIYLRPIDVEDITNGYISGLNDPEVNRYLVNVRKNIQTRESVEDYVFSNKKDPSSILFGIFVKDSVETLIGTVRVSGIDFFHYMASIGVCLFDKSAWKKGYALQAIKMVKQYLFEVHCLHYLEAGAYAQNKQSVKLFTRSGFSEWYRVKNKYRLVDSFEEVIFFGAINPAFDQSVLRTGE
jgi:RimJ/RimL family protein N-acetyltransferase